VILIINGQPQQFSQPLRVDQLLAELDLSGKRLAIELNGNIIPRSEFSAVILQDNDRLEIVVAVGGG